MNATPKLRNLSPNSTNLLIHVQRAHLQMTLCKAADRHSPPDIDISNFGYGRRRIASFHRVSMKGMKWTSRSCATPEIAEEFHQMHRAHQHAAKAVRLEVPKIPSWATKSDFICDLIMGTQNHQQTLYLTILQGSLYGHRSN